MLAFVKRGKGAPAAAGGGISIGRYSAMAIELGGAFSGACMPTRELARPPSSHRRIASNPGVGGGLVPSAPVPPPP